MQNNLDKLEEWSRKQTPSSRDKAELCVCVGVNKYQKTDWGTTSTAAVLQKKIEG